MFRYLMNNPSYDRFSTTGPNVSPPLSNLKGQSGMRFCLVLTDSSDRTCTSKWLVFVMKILGYHGNIALKL